MGGEIFKRQQENQRNNSSSSPSSKETLVVAVVAVGRRGEDVEGESGRRAAMKEGGTQLRGTGDDATHEQPARPPASRNGGPAASGCLRQ